MQPHPFQRQFVVCRLGLATINLYTNLKSLYVNPLQVYILQIYESRRIMQKFGLFGVKDPNVNGNITIRWSADNFLFDFNRNYVPIFTVFES